MTNFVVFQQLLYGTAGSHLLRRIAGVRDGGSQCVAATLPGRRVWLPRTRTSVREHDMIIYFERNSINECGLIRLEILNRYKRFLPSNLLSDANNDW